MSDKKIDIVSRAVITHGGKILLVRLKSANWYFLPGGHIEYGEPITKAIQRELKEEIGVRPSNVKLIGIAENSFYYKKELKHEINFVFQARVDHKKIKLKEGHIELVWKDKKKLAQERLVPKVLKTHLIQWFKNKKLFLNP